MHFLAFKLLIRKKLIFLSIFFFLCYCSYMLFTILFIPFYYSIVDFPFTYPDIHLNFTNVKDIVNYYQSPELQNAVYYCNDSTELVVIVMSQTDKPENRMFIRNTWGKEKTYKSELKFIVGLKHGNNKNNAIFEEQRLYKDLIITNVYESYYNITFKSLAILTLTPDFCKSAKCILKVDTDNAVDIQEFEKICTKHSSKNEIHGLCMENVSVFRRKLFPEKLTIPKYVYEKAMYPKYCAGGNYMITGNKTTEKLLHSLKEYGFLTSRNKQMLFEDTFYTGILAENANVTRVNNDRIIPCVIRNVDCIHRKVLPKNWISIRFGDENLPSLQKCCLKNHWKTCLTSEIIQKAKKDWLKQRIKISDFLRK